MPSYRPERVAEMVHRELAQRLRLDIKDPELTDISIVHIEMTRDLGRAKVYYLPLGGGEVTKSLQGALERAGKRLRGPIGRALRLRSAPEFVWIVDQHTDDAARMTSLLSQLSAARDDEQGEDA